MGGLSIEPILDPPRPPNPQTGGMGVEKSPIQVAVKRLEIDENVNKFGKTLSGSELCLKQSYSIPQSPEWVTHIECGRRAA